jgi:glycosyl-4,4'-diaponeurosporenoate acyltransferase
MLLHLPILWAVLLDIAAWLAIHLWVVWACSQPGPERFGPAAWWYRERPCEMGGRLYEVIFNVKAWKCRVPDGAALFRKRFPKGRLRETAQEY